MKALFVFGLLLLAVVSAKVHHKHKAKATQKYTNAQYFGYYATFCNEDDREPFPFSNIDGLFRDNTQKVANLAPYKVFARVDYACPYPYKNCNWTYPDASELISKHNARTGMSGHLVVRRSTSSAAAQLEFRSCPSTKDPIDQATVGSCASQLGDSTEINCGSTRSLYYHYNDLSVSDRCDRKSWIFNRGDSYKSETIGKTQVGKKCFRNLMRMTRPSRSRSHKWITEYVFAANLDKVDWNKYSKNDKENNNDASQDMTIFEHDHCKASNAPAFQPDSVFVDPLQYNTVIGTYTTEVRRKHCNSRGCSPWRRYTVENNGLRSTWLGGTDADGDKRMIHGFNGDVLLKRDRSGRSFLLDFVTTQCDAIKQHVLTHGRFSANGTLTFSTQTYGLIMESLITSKCFRIDLLNQAASRTHIPTGTIKNNCVWQKYRSTVDSYGSQVEVVIHSSLESVPLLQDAKRSFQEQVAISEDTELTPTCSARIGSAFTSQVAKTFLDKPTDNIGLVAPYLGYLRYRRCHKTHGCRPWIVKNKADRGSWLKPADRKYAGMLVDGWTGMIQVKRRYSKFQITLNSQCRGATDVADTVVMCEAKLSNSSRSSKRVDCGDDMPALRFWDMSGTNCEHFRAFPYAKVDQASAIISTKCISMNYKLSNKRSGEYEYYEWEMEFTGQNVAESIAAAKVKGGPDYVPSPVFENEDNCPASSSSLTQAKAMSYFTHPLQYEADAGTYLVYSRERRCRPGCKDPSDCCTEWKEEDTNRRELWFLPTTSEPGTRMAGFRGTAHLYRDGADNMRLILRAGDCFEADENNPAARVARCFPRNGDTSSKEWECESRYLSIYEWYDKCVPNRSWKANLVSQTGPIIVTMKGDCFEAKMTWSSSTMHGVGDYKERELVLLGKLNTPPDPVPLPKDDTNDLHPTNAFSPKNCPSSGRGASKQLSNSQLDTITSGVVLDPKTQTRTASFGRYTGYYRYKQCCRRGCSVWKYAPLGHQSLWRKSDSMDAADEVVGWDGLVTTQRDEGSKKHTISLRTNYCERDLVMNMHKVVKCRSNTDFRCSAPSLYVSKLRTPTNPRPYCRAQSHLPFTQSLYHNRGSGASFSLTEDCMKILYHLETTPNDDRYWSEMEVAFTSDLMTGKLKW